MDTETNFMEAVSMVNNVVNNKSRYAFILSEIKENMEECSSCITHICGSANCASCFMANFCSVELLYGLVWSHRTSWTLSYVTVIPNVIQH